MEKKGAIDVSMGMIIAIIIGVLLLIIGIAFITGLSKRGVILTEDVFDKAEDEIKNLGSINKFLTISPSKIEIEIGKVEPVAIAVKNFESETIHVTLKASPGKTEINCFFLDTESKTSKEYSIPSGQHETTTLIVDASKQETGTRVCNIEVIGAPLETTGTSAQLLITVIPKKGFFGF